MEEAALSPLPSFPAPSRFGGAVKIFRQQTKKTRDECHRSTRKREEELAGVFVVSRKGNRF